MKCFEYSLQRDNVCPTI